MQNTECIHSRKVDYIVIIASLPAEQYCSPYMLYFFIQSMGRIVPPFRQLYDETISDLTMELKAALVDLGHKSAFDLLLKEAWNPEQGSDGQFYSPDGPG